MRVLKQAGALVKKTVEEFIADDCMSLAASLAYYTIFSLPPLLVLVFYLAGLLVDPQEVRGVVDQQLEGVVQKEGLEQLYTMLENARHTGSGLFATVFGIGLLVFAATTVLAQLQYSLNKAWEVQPDPASGGVKHFLLKRCLSLAMILGIAFLLLVSLVLSTALSVIGTYFQDLVPSGAYQTMLTLGNTLISFAVVTLLFAAIFKVLPDAKVAWRDVWLGAAITALLFVIGKEVIGIYLAKSGVASTYGAAGSLVLILLWVYYSSLILLVGAEFTQVWARRYGKQIEPSYGAVRIVYESREIRSASEAAQHDRQKAAVS